MDFEKSVTKIIMNHNCIPLLLQKILNFLAFLQAFLSIFTPILMFVVKNVKKIVSKC